MSNPSPFTSEGYPFSKDLNVYDATSLGRAFFSDGYTAKIGGFELFDSSNIFKAVLLKDEPLFYKKMEISVTVFTTGSNSEFVEKYNKLALNYDEIAIFLVQPAGQTQASVAIALGDSLLKLSNLKKNAPVTNLLPALSAQQISTVGKSLSGKALISLLNKGNKIFNDTETVNQTINVNKEDTEVAKIKIASTLDKGAANDGLSYYLNRKPVFNLQEGMIYGKSYIIEVLKFTKAKPKDAKKIKWSLKFHNLSTDKWEEIPTTTTGTRVKLSVLNNEVCGRFLYIRAYINDKEAGDEIKVWVHNRFRWFDRLVVEQEIEEHLISPWKINQAHTSLCGMACIFYLFAKEQPQEYKKFAKTLFRTGVATFNNYTVSPADDILEKKISIAGYPDGVGRMPLVDFITMAGTRNTVNKNYKGGSEDFAAINWPHLMTTLSEKLLGYENVTSKGIYNPIKTILYSNFEVTKKIEDLNNQIRDGYKIILMIDSDMINDDPSDKLWELEYHWIVLEGVINNRVPMLNSNGNAEHYIDFSVFSWGTNPLDKRTTVIDPKTKKSIPNKDQGYLKLPISQAHFIKNYYGYIKLK